MGHNTSSALPPAANSPPAALKHACESLGLKSKPPIPAVDVKTDYRAAMVRAHPDKGGNNEHAAIIDAAYAFLKPFSKSFRLRQCEAKHPRQRGVVSGKDAPKRKKGGREWRNFRACRGVSHLIADPTTGPPPAGNAPVPSGGFRLGLC
jgi:hypothetical protein